MSRRYRVLLLLVAGGLLEWAVQGAAGLFGAQANQAALLFAALGFLLAGVWPYSGRTLVYLVVAAAPLGLIYGHAWAHPPAMVFRAGLVINDTGHGGAGPWLVGSVAVTAFLIGAFYAWLAVQRGEAWSAVALAGGTFLLRADVDAAYAARFFPFVGAALGLVVLINARSGQRMVATLVSAAAGVAVLFLAWQAPVPNPTWAHPFDDPVTQLVNREQAAPPATQLDLNGAFHPSNRMVMSIRMPDAPPDPYWQTAIFDRYDGHSWQITVGGTRAVSAGARLYEGIQPAGRRVLSAQVTVLQATQVIASPGASVRVSEPASAVYAEGGAEPVMLRSRARLAAGSVYRVEGMVPGGASPAPSPAAQAVNLQLPPEPSQLRFLALRLVRGQHGVLDELQAILSYLRDGSIFHYDANAGSPPGRDAVADFLFRSHRGYCSQFASAMVVLAREAGIPARLVAGYATGSPVQGRYIVRQRDAHSWVEGYVPGAGWVSFDPTPGFSLGRVAAARTAGVRAASTAVADVSRPALPATTRPRSPVPGFVSSVPEARLLVDHVGRPTPLQGALLLLFALTIWWMYRCRPRSLEEMYVGLARGGAARGLTIGPAETPGEFVERWQARPRDYPAVRLIGDLYARQRYSGVSISQAELREARRAWRRLRRPLTRGWPQSNRERQAERTGTEAGPYE